MQFNHPEVLYALLLLLIPIFIHLFQLRKYKKVPFSNVALLKKVNIQTRKSSRLKKWLTLILRMLAIACLVLAFAQPFSASSTATRKEREIVLYLDNSFSMQLAGSNGPLLQRAQQELFNLPLPEGRISWFTNDKIYRNVSASDFRQEVLKTGYTFGQLDIKACMLNAQNLFTNNPLSLKQFIVVSDFQGDVEPFPDVEDMELGVVRTIPISTENIAIDSLAVLTRERNSAKIRVWVSKTGPEDATVPVSLFRDETLIAKVSLTLNGEKSQEVDFDIEHQNSFKGYVEIEDYKLLYDNTLYFNLSPINKIKVLAVNQGEFDYLDRMFGQPEFAYTKQDHLSMNYSDLLNQNLVILNQLKTIPASLITTLTTFISNGGSVGIIPSGESNLESYNQLLQELGLGRFHEKVSQEKRINQIRFSHSLYKEVFEKEVANFQYPKVKVYYPLTTRASKALIMDGENPFLVSNRQAYLFSAPLDKLSGNFTASPLIVPTLYNMALRSLPPIKPYFQIDRQNTFTVDNQLMADEILMLANRESKLIPAQQNRPNGTLVTTTDLPNKAGIYQVRHNDSILDWVSYNYPRSESRLVYNSWPESTTAKQFNSVNSMVDYLGNENRIDSYWKWFVILALLFLLCEMLVLKFLNP